MNTTRTGEQAVRAPDHTRQLADFVGLLRHLAVPGLSLSLLAFGLAHIWTSARSEPVLAPPAPPPRTPYGEAIAAAGVVEPQSENVRVGAPLSGVVVAVSVTPDDTGKAITKGQPLFQVDDRHLRAQLALAQARLDVPQAQLARLEQLPRPEEVVPVRYRVDALRADAIRAKDEYERMLRLAGSQTISEATLVASRQRSEAADAELDRAQAELDLLTAGAWDADKAVARAEIARIEAEIRQIQTEIERTAVTAPMDGMLLQVNVRSGEFVATPPTKDLIVIGDMRRPRIRVEIDESDIPRFRPGLPAQAIVRGSQEHTISLSFVRTDPFVVPKTSLTGANTERVDTRVLPVLYEIQADAPSVFVGQQVDVFIPVEPPAARP